MGLRVWVDLTNSPHVLVLRAGDRAAARAGRRRAGHRARLRADRRAGAAVRPERETVGRHRGARLGAKAVGLADRSLALLRWGRGRRFDLALGHGSNDVTVAARMLRIPCSTMFDYEWATVQHTINCRLAQAVVVPDAIPPQRLDRYGARRKLRRYPGLKEEYYLADLEPDPAVLGALGLDPSEPIAVVRTPPVVSLYHRFENDLFGALLTSLRDQGQVVVLPRTERPAHGAARRGRLHRPRPRDRRAVARRAGRPRRQRRGHDESRGGGARDARLDDVRGQARGGRRAVDGRGPPAPHRAPAGRRARAPRPRRPSPSACGATRSCSWTCCAVR